jgi:2-polyprenyl-3-methyl-5-hydroxy-6-metoxy-1,4-benzoquinol methylase
MINAQERQYLQYSKSHPEILDRSRREVKARKIEEIILNYYNQKGTSVANLQGLDVGCASGIVTNRLSRNLENVIGIDIDTEALRLATRASTSSSAYVAADSERLPFRAGVFDLVVCNHVYQVVRDAYRMMNEINRVLRSHGSCYFAAANRLMIVESDYHLLFLSWLPRKLANLYLQLFRGSVAYQRRYLSLWGLRKLAGAFHVYDYTIKVIEYPDRFHAEDLLGSGTVLHKVARRLSRIFYFLIPTYLWILEKT